MTKQIPEEVAERLKLLLKPIAEMFRASKITIILRAPEEGNSVGDLILSNDNPTKAVEALRYHLVSEARRFADEGAKSGTPEGEFPKYRNLDEI